MSRWRTSLQYRTMADETGVQRFEENHNRAGLTFVPALAMIVVLLAVGSSTIITTMKHMDRVVLNERLIQALAIAEKGVALSMYELERDADLDQSSGVGNVAGDFANGQYVCTSTALPEDRYRLQSRGTFKGLKREITVIVTGPSESWASRWILGKGGLQVSGNLNVDSYDSSEGTYESQAVNSDGGGSGGNGNGNGKGNGNGNGNSPDVYANSNAKLASNGSISAGPNADIRGDLQPGPDGTITLHQNTFVSGKTDPLSQTLNVPDPPLAEFQKAYNDNKNGTWKVKGKVKYNQTDRSLALNANSTLELNPGDYFFSSLTINGNANIVTTGKTRIFVVGDIKITGGAVTNRNARPMNFELIAHPYNVFEGCPPTENPSIKIAGGSAVSLVMYAPAYSVKVTGQGKVKGAIVGNDVELNTSDFHFDESLLEETGLTAMDPNRLRKYLRLAWIERNPKVY